MLTKFKTLVAVAGIALSVLAVSSQNAVAATISYTTLGNGSVRGTVTAGGTSLGAFTATPTFLSFQAIEYSGNYSDILSFDSQYVDFGKTSGSVTVSAPSGAGGIGTSPFVFSTFAASLSNSTSSVLTTLRTTSFEVPAPSTLVVIPLPPFPQPRTFTGANSLSITFTYLLDTIRYSLSASDIDPATGELFNLTMAGVLNNSTNGISSSSSAVIRSTGVPEPSTLISIPIFGIAVLGFSNKLRKRHKLD